MEEGQLDCCNKMDITDHDYGGGTKTWGKAAGCFCGWTTKIYNSREQHLQERCKSCRHDIEMTEINAYQQIANCQICSIATWCQTPES